MNRQKKRLIICLSLSLAALIAFGYSLKPRATIDRIYEIATPLPLNQMEEAALIKANDLRRDYGEDDRRFVSALARLAQLYQLDNRYASAEDAWNECIRIIKKNNPDKLELTQFLIAARDTYLADKKTEQSQAISQELTALTKIDWAYNIFWGSLLGVFLIEAVYFARILTSGCLKQTYWQYYAAGIFLSAIGMIQGAYCLGAFALQAILIGIGIGYIAMPAILGCTYAFAAMSTPRDYVVILNAYNNARAKQIR